MALTTTEVAEFARQARELMNDGGDHWTQGDYVTLDLGGVRRFCMIGAVRHSLFGEADGDQVNESDPRFIAITYALKDAIRELFPNRAGTPAKDATSVVIDFNDDDDTTWEDVEVVLRHAEKALAA